MDPLKTTGQKKTFWQKLGPGLVTGASDDDPSGITTYSQAGARFGTHLLWTALVTYPLMVAIQEMCARVGLVTKKGLTGVICHSYPRWTLYLLLGLSFPAIVLNIGADIAGMGAVAHLLFPSIPAFLYSLLFTAFLMYAIVFWNYHRIARVLKWLCLSLFCYLIIPFLVETNWREVFWNTVWPLPQWSRGYFLALVGILGTTISPYLFFWQASMEMEEINRQHLVVDKRILLNMKTDVRWGLLLTNLVFYFIILSSATVLYPAGIHQIETVEDAAKALLPLGGKAAYFLFGLGVIGTGFLAIPVLAGSLSYMVAETFGWKEGLNRKFHQAKGFYLTMVLSLFVGLLIDLLDFSPVQALLYTAVLYGFTAPFLIAMIMHICNNKTIMGSYTNDWKSNFLGFISLFLMVGAALALLLF